MQHIRGNKKQAHKTGFGKSYDEITLGTCTYCEQKNKEIHFKEKGSENQDWIKVAQEEVQRIICNHRGEALGFTTVEEISYSTVSYSLHVIRVFREDPQNEFSLFIGLKCGWNNAVHTRWQLEATAHFT